MRTISLFSAILLVLAMGHVRAQDLTAEEQAQVAEMAEAVIDLKLALVPKLKERGYGFPRDSMLPDAKLLEKTLASRTGEAALARTAAEGYRWGLLLTATRGKQQVMVGVFAAESPRAALLIRDMVLLGETRMKDLLEKEGGKLLTEKEVAVSPPGSQGGHAWERSVVMPGKKETSCLDKVIVSSGRYVIEVTLLGPMAEKDTKLVRHLTTAAMEGLGADTTPPRAK